MTQAKKHIVRALCLLAALAMLLSAFDLIGLSVQAEAVTQAEIDALKAQRSELSAEKNAKSVEIKLLQDERAGVTAQKAALDEQNELTRQEIELINEQIALYEQLIAEKEIELDEAAAVEAAQLQAYRKHLRAMEESGAISYLEILFQARSFADLLSRLGDISDIMSADKRLEDECIAARERVQRVKADYEAAQTEFQAAKVELLEKKAQLETDIEAACRLIADLEADIEAHMEEYEAMEAEMADMDAKITEMIQAFELQKTVGTGYYIWPLPGYSAGSRTFGRQFHPIDHVWKTHSGQDIGAPAGTRIIAADGGTVSTASYGWNGGYGNYVIINHGNGRATLYAHMSSIAVTAGSSIRQGDTVGYVGSTGKSTGPHLHFEVRENGVAVDPMQYFGV
jgi:murein DD-endopeptidase MepM/ murein hydrolase activator NlpD